MKNIFNNTWWQRYGVAITAIGTIITSITAITAVIIACIQINGANKIAKADFIYRFNNDFVNSGTSEIFTLFGYKALKFEEHDSICFFRIDTVRLKKINPDYKLLKSNRKIYTSDEMDVLFLGRFEDLGSFKSSGLINEDFLYDGFSADIKDIGENKEVLKYIQYLRIQPNGKDFYEKFELLYKKYNSGKGFDFSKLKK